MRTFPIVTTLPNSYYRGIGAVMVRWAYQERILSNIAHSLLNVGPKHGRVAVRSPRPDEYITMIQQLMALEGVTVDCADLGNLATALRGLSKARDLVAHGVWLKNPETGQLLIQDLSGTWRPEPKAPKVARRITPEGVAIDYDELKELARLIDATTATSLAVHRELAKKLKASRSKSAEQPQ